VKQALKWGFLGAYVIACVVLTIVFKFRILDCFVAITGVMYIWLLAERSMLNFIVGFINVSCYIVVCYLERIYGDAIFYLVVDIPLAVTGFVVWRRAIARKTQKVTMLSKVDSRQIRPRYYLPIMLALAGFAIGFGFFLRAIGGINVWIDATSTAVSILATILMVLHFKEQWFMWVAVYMLSIALWVVTDNVLMIMMSVGCLLASFMGWVTWYRNSRAIKCQSPGL